MLKIIDFHTHVFPDKIAQRTIAFLSEKGGIPPFSDGTRKGLLEKMEEADTLLSVNLPVLTNPGQFDSVNRFAEEMNSFYREQSRGILSFAGIHPHCENVEEKMRWIKSKGFLGIKIHPDYQETFINDDAYVRIVTLAKEYDLIVVTHAGVDGGYRDCPVRCTPERVLDLLRKAPHSKLVLAHMGANEMSEQVYESLCGEDVYFDTAYVLRFTDRETFQKILDKHGEDRILFATDSPWSDLRNDINILRSYQLGAATEQKIFYENALRLLKG